LMENNRPLDYFISDFLEERPYALVEK